MTDRKADAADGRARDTEALIARLAADAAPVRPLRRPGLRALGFLLAALGLIAVITAIEGLQPGLGRALADPAFALGRGAAIVTAVTATIAAFEVSLPDRPLRWLWLPLPSAAVWLGGMGAGCLADWLAEGPAGLRPGQGLPCLEAILLTSLPLAGLLLVLLRHAGPVRPVPTAAAGGLALAAIAEGGLTLYHDVEATLTDTLMHLLAVALVIVGLTGGARRLFGLLLPRALGEVMAGRARLGT